MRSIIFIFVSLLFLFCEAVGQADNTEKYSYADYGIEFDKALDRMLDNGDLIKSFPASSVVEFNIFDNIIRDDFDQVSLIVENNHVDQIYDLFLSCVKGNGNKVGATCIDELKAVRASDWLDKHHKSVLLAVLYLRYIDVTEGLRHVTESISVIPNSDGSLENNARYQALYLYTLGYIYDHDVDGAITSLNKMIDTSLKARRSFSIADIIYNSAFLFNLLSDYSIAGDLLGKAFPLDVGASDIDIFVMNVGQGINLYEIGNYHKSIEHFELALNHVSNSDSVYAAKLKLALAYAAGGRYDESDKIITYIEHELSESQIDNLSNTYDLYKSKSMIYASRGDYNSAYQFLDYSNKIVNAELKESLSVSRINLSSRMKSEQLKTSEALHNLELLKSNNDLKSNIFIVVIISLVLIMMGVVWFSRRLMSQASVLAASESKLKLALRAKSDLIGKFSHEMMTPLNGILPIVDLIMKQENNGKLLKLMNIVKKSANEIHRKVNNILLVSEPDVYEPIMVEIRAIDLAHELVRHIDGNDFRGRVFFHMQRDIDDMLVKTDVRSLKCIVDELLSNALKFSGGMPCDMNLQYDGADSICLLVKDLGEGIDLESIEELMSPFEQASSGMSRRYDGIGLGLNVASTYAKKIGSSLKFLNNEPKGTIAFVSVPVLV